MTYIRFFLVLYWFATFLKFETLPSKNPRYAPEYVMLFIDMRKLINVNNSYEWAMSQKLLVVTHKAFKASIKSQISIGKSAQSY